MPLSRITLVALGLSVLCLPAVAATVDVPNPLGGGAAAPRSQPARPGASPSKLSPASAPTASGSSSAVFPKAVDPKYAREPAGKARQQTCLDQYRVNAGAGNGGLRWIEKGGGYYSECNRRLKG